MIRNIAKKEFLLNLMTFKFAVGTILGIVLTAVFVPILAKDYQQRLNTYSDNVARNEAELRKVKVYKNITPTLYRPPALLSVFSEGLEKRVDDSAMIEMENVPQMRGAAIQGNPYQAVFPVFDASLIFKIVIGVLALLVAYDTIAGEREQGTLKLILSGTVRRYQILLGKLIAGLMVLLVPVTVAFILGLVILLCFPMVNLARSDWMRIALMYLTSLVFISAMYNVGLLFSCLAKKSAVSLVLGLFLWVVLVVVVPNASVYFAAQLQPLQPEEEIDGQIMALQQEHKNELDRSRPAMSNVAMSGARDAFGHWYPRLINRNAMAYYQEYNRLECVLGIKYADKFLQVERAYINGLVAQRNLAANLARVSPISLYDNAMSSLAGTNISSFQSFAADVKAHRDRIIEYVRSRTEDFSSSAFFTTCTKEEMEQYEKGADSGGEHPSLELSDFPRFVHKADIVGDLRGAVPDMALLIFVNMLFFALSFAAFAKSEYR
jgi:ABC-type transport system involved in multi-copper enzyme maturation permease subunit